MRHAVRRAAQAEVVCRESAQALACGQDANTIETRNMLCDWADYVIVVDKEYAPEVPEKYKDKLLIYDIGVDRFGYAFHPELLTIADQCIIQHGLFNQIVNV